MVITGFNRDPMRVGGLIFQDSLKATLFEPAGPGSGSPVSRYTSTERRGAYTINPAGAESLSVAAFPEQATLLPFSSGLVGLVCLRRRAGPR